MSITSTAEVMTALGVQGPQNVARYDLLRTYAEQSVIDYCHWQIEAFVGKTEYHDGSGGTDILLNGLYATNAQVWYDPGGAYGQSNGAFPNPPLVQGQDWVLAYDMPGSTVSKSARIVKYASTQPMQGWWLSNYVWNRTAGLSFVDRPSWPRSLGSVKVVYDSGFATDSGDTVHPPMPATIKAAVAEIVGILASSIQYGGPLQSESLAGYSYSLASIDRKREFLNVRMALGQYRDTSLGTALA